MLDKVFLSNSFFVQHLLQLLLRNYLNLNFVFYRRAVRTQLFDHLLYEVRFGSYYGAGELYTCRKHRYRLTRASRYFIKSYSGLLFINFLQALLLCTIQFKRIVNIC